MAHHSLAICILNVKLKHKTLLTLKLIKGGQHNFRFNELQDMILFLNDIMKIFSNKIPFI